MPDPAAARDRWRDRVAAQERRKLRARRRGTRAPWFGLGMYGLVGWSVVIPTLIGVALGLWIDSRWPSRFSWTIMLMVAGLLVGCWNAWYWISLEQRAIRDEDRDGPGEGSHG